MTSIPSQTFIKDTNYYPDISIIIPTFNESKNLPLLLSDLSEINCISEILIIDSISTDKTKDIALLNGADFYKLNKKNRGLQLNLGAKKAKGKWLFFIHADSRLNPNWSKEIENIINCFSEIIYYFKFKVNNKKFRYRVLELLVNLRCRIFSNPYGDQGILINKFVFDRNGGYSDLPLMEDIDFIKKFKKKKNLKQLKGEILTSSRKWERINFIFQGIYNWYLRRKWQKGASLEEIYSQYYKN